MRVVTWDEYVADFTQISFRDGIVPLEGVVFDLFLEPIEDGNRFFPHVAIRKEKEEVDIEFESAMGFGNVHRCVIDVHEFIFDAGGTQQCGLDDIAIKAITAVVKQSATVIVRMERLADDEPQVSLLLEGKSYAEEVVCSVAMLRPFLKIPTLEEYCALLVSEILTAAKEFAEG